MTYSRVLMDPLDARPDQILIEDIAHSLSLMTRANGHCRQCYSVAQHSINCAQEAKNLGLSPRVQLACLLHDAAETYIADIPRPVKHRLTGFADIEENMQRVIFHKFGLDDMTDEEWEAVAHIDDALLHAEFDALMGIPIFETAPYLSQEYDFGPQDMDSVYRTFVRMFYELTPPPVGARKVVGVDGCKGGWAAVALTGNRVDVEVFATVSDLFAAHADAEVFLIDMPIGLPESPDDERPEEAARAMLPGKASSIFNCPCRQAVYADPKDASALNREVLGKALSAQSFGIIPKIRELDEYLTAHEDIRPRVLESHPELCFAMLSGSPVQESKHTPKGQQKRLEILSPFCREMRGAVEHAGFSKKQAALDDLIDAACLAVVARLSLERPLKTVPERPKKDARGLTMQMIYAELNKQL